MVISMQLANRITVQQTQCLSIALRQSLFILEKTNCELRDLIVEEHQSNPMLELAEPKEREAPDVQLDAIGKWLEETTVPDRESGWIPEERTEFDISDQKKGICLAEHLQEQIVLSGLSQEDYEDVCIIILLLDSSGYLRESEEEICAVTGMSPQRCQRAVAAVRSLEPRGVGCRNLGEFLILQLQDLGVEDEKFFEVLRENLEAFAMGEYQLLSERAEIPAKKLREYARTIRTLRPRPATGFYQSDDAQYIVPDIIVRGNEEEYEILLNDRWMGSVNISSCYRSYLKMSQDARAREYCRERLERAKWLINCIEQRRATLTAVANEIVLLQAPFLLGRGELRPMNLRSIADKLGIHESTVSRAVKDKYIQTPKTVYSLKSLFSWGLASADDAKESVSRQSVKDRIKRIVEDEDTTNPKTDADIAGELETMGMTISRRTVAKYREEMGILNRSERRESA